MEKSDQGEAGNMGKSDQGEAGNMGKSQSERDESSSEYSAHG